jgi:hypothetical protein
VRRRLSSFALPISPWRAGKAFHQKIEECLESRRSLSAALENDPQREALRSLKILHERDEPPTPDGVGDDDVAEADDSRPLRASLRSMCALSATTGPSTSTVTVCRSMLNDQNRESGI